MVSTRSALLDFAAHVDESMGVRHDGATPPISPIASVRDAGRTPLRKFGRVEFDRVSPDPNQPRAEFHEDEIQRLASSIRKAGQLHPIRVRWDASVEKWIIVTGERRFRAAITAGLAAIDCYFHEDGITRSEILEQQLVENLLRRDLKPLEEARGYATLMEINGWTGKQVAAALHVSTSRVSRALALLELPEEVQSRIRSGEISRTAAYELSKLDKESVQRAIAGEAAARELTHRQTVKAVRRRKGKTLPRARGTRQVFPAESGVKVTVTADRRVNYLQIEQALVEALTEVRLRIDNNVEIY